MPSKENLQDECKKIEDDARHTAEAHYILAARSKRLSLIFEIIPATVAALSGTLVVGEFVAIEWGWVTVLTAVVTATSTVISPHKSYYENLNAAKSFTVIKNKANRLRISYPYQNHEEEYYRDVKSLAENYDQLVLLTPPTQQGAYSKAKKKIAYEQKDE